MRKLRQLGQLRKLRQASQYQGTAEKQAAWASPGIAKTSREIIRPGEKIAWIEMHSLNIIPQ